MPRDPGYILCFVLGCRERAIACAVSRHHGRVAYCDDHHLERHAYALPYHATPERRQAPAVATRRPDIGPQSPVRPIGPSDPTPPRPDGIDAIPTWTPAPRVPVADLEF